MMIEQHIAILLSKRFNNEITTAEEAELNEWISASEANEAFYQDLLNKKRLSEKVQLFRSFNREAGWNKLEKRIPGLGAPRQPQVKKLYKWMAAAAIMALVAAIWLFTGRKQGAVPQVLVHQKADTILPGGDKATLTLGDGRVVVLDTASGAIHETGHVINFAAGQLSYAGESAQDLTAQPIVYNTLKTPPGGQYKLILPDGSRVWMNAASSLRFPTRFTSGHREVILEGEGFFEIAPAATAPFLVNTNGIQINILGTAFNVMAYNDEPAAEVTLVAGKVAVEKANITKMLSPGQQARLIQEQADIQVRNDVNVEDVIAWKEGLFRFQSADIKSVLRQISRWYNIGIVYEGPVTKEKFTGDIPRNSSIEEVTRILRLSNIHLSLQNGRMIVKP